MADTLLTVSSVTDANWTSSQQVESNRQLKDISYKITLNGRTTIRVVFPVFSPGDYTSIPQNEALLTQADWQNINLLVKETDGVVANRNGMPLGVYTINITNTALTEFVFQLQLQNDITPYSGTSKAVCKLQYGVSSGGRMQWVDLPNPATIVITPNIDPPAVIKFTATHIVVASDEKTTLQWEVINSKSIVIYNGANKLSVPDNQFKGEIITSKLSSSTIFTLTIDNGVTDPVSMSITIKVSANSAFIPEKEYLFDGQKLMGLYQWNSKLYALVLYDADVIESNVLFWESYDGLNWTKTNVYSKTPAFNNSNYSNLTDAYNVSASNATVPVDFAGSPGVIYNSKLYLIGGSRFDSDFRSSSVYFFDFGAPEAGWQQDTDAGFTPRMGHACVIYRGEIWVIGGYGDQGASNEVWKFDGVKWGNVSANTAYALKANRCMASAMVNSNGNIEIYGGFGDFPGSPDQTLANSYELTDTWRPIALSTGTETLNYLNCTAVQTRGQTFILNTVYDTKLIDRIQMLVRNNTITLKDILNPTDFGIQEYIFNIQAVDFKDVVWVCTLNKMDTIKSNLLSYFVYVPLNFMI
jgi:hypothetical protein